MRNLVDYIKEGKSNDILKSLEMKEFNYSSYSLIYDIADEFCKFYEIDKDEHDDVYKEIVKAIDCYRETKEKPSTDDVLPIMFDKSAYEKLNKDYKDGKLEIAQNPEVFPVVSHKKHAPLIVLYKSSLGNIYYIWYIGTEDNRWADGADEWQEIKY